MGVHLGVAEGVGVSGSKKSPSGDCDTTGGGTCVTLFAAPDQKNPRQGTVTTDW